LRRSAGSRRWRASCARTRWPAWVHPPLERAAPTSKRPVRRRPGASHRPSASSASRGRAYHPAVLRDEEVSVRARRLANAIEPVVGQVYFSPECHAEYVALGFSPSPAEIDGVAMPDGPAYFTSRGSLMGHVPGEPMGDFWRQGDQLREYRGDAHTAAWTSGGFDATEIGLLTELFIGIPLRTYIRSRAWSDAQLDAAEARLDARGLLSGGQFTDEGRAAREAVEQATDRQMRPAIEAIGDDFDELVGIIEPWSAQVRAAGGYIK